MLLALGVIVGFLRCVAALQHFTPARDREWPLSTSTGQGGPSLFAAVLSRRNELTMRSQVRPMWAEAALHAGVLSVTSKFLVCWRAEDGLDDALRAEALTHGDLWFADCQEGYRRGLLSRKVLSAMQIYRTNFSDRDFFMKVDIDTFVDWKKLAARVASAGSPLSYMGVPLPSGEGHVTPCRNESSRWFEPWSTYAEEKWPRSMAGGTGYILGNDLVAGILDTGIAENNILNNEDRGTGVWIRKLQENTGIAANFTTISGTDWWDFEWGWTMLRKQQLSWGQYGETLQHGLSGESIVCLARAAAVTDPSQLISGCFLGSEQQRPAREGCWAAVNERWVQAGAERAAAGEVQIR